MAHNGSFAVSEHALLGLKQETANPPSIDSESAARNNVRVQSIDN
jgi:hypothetical protein